MEPIHIERPVGSPTPSVATRQIARHVPGILKLMQVANNRRRRHLILQRLGQRRRPEGSTLGGQRTNNSQLNPVHSETHQCLDPRRDWG